MLIFGQDAMLGRWAGAQLGISDFGKFSAIGVARGGDIVAVAVYNKYFPPSIELSFASTSPRWASKQVIAALFWNYPFGQLGLNRITALVAVGNDCAIRTLERLGFCREGYHRDILSSGDGVSYGLLRSDAERWRLKQ